MPAERTTALIDRLGPVRGDLSADASLARYTWFKTGGPADVLFRPADKDDLAEFLTRLPRDVPLTLLGNASNLLVRDGGVEGVVIRLGRGFSDISVDGEDVLAGAAAADLNVARKARDAGLAGLEFLAGVPGTIGGALVMNAGAYGAEIADIFVSATVLDRSGAARELDADAMSFSYRRSVLGADDIVTAARLRGVHGDAASIAARMAEIQSEREASQPVRTLTGGSTFKNPGVHKAWELIDAAGCRGLRRGAAVVSEKHCNFLVNEGGATAADLEGLGEEVRRRVKDHSGVLLEWEVRRIGRMPASAIGEVAS